MRNRKTVLIPLLIALLTVPAGFAYVHWSKGGSGAGLYSRYWSPDPVQGYWDPASFYQSPDSVQGVFEGKQCIQCHEGPASHSYVSSKHGVITRLEKGGHNWRLPLQRGNYRAPGCSYCHLHDGDHGNSMAPDRGPEVRQWVCSGCHSPRYIREQFANAKRHLEIADLKLTEGEDLLRSVDGTQPDGFAELREGLIQHRRNVLLGVGHQSPDYQWWYGQPALDGDLIRIRDAVAESRFLDASLLQTKQKNPTTQHTKRER